MPQFPIPPGKQIGATVPLSADDSKHLARVLRINPGEIVTVFDICGRIPFLCMKGKLAPLTSDQVLAF